MRLAHQHHHGQGHAALASGAKRGTGNRVERLLLVRVGQDDGVVLGAHHALRALAGQGGAVVHMGAHLGGAHERHGLDVPVVADRVHSHFAAVDHVEHAGWNAGFERQLHQAHGHHRVLLGGLQHKGVARGNRHREHPQRDHGREVEGGDACAHAQRLQQGVGIDTTGHVVGQLAQLQVADAGGVFNHFEATEHITFGVGQGLALFCRQDGGQLGHVLADKLLVLEEDAGAGADGRLLPGFERFLGRGHGGVDFFSGGKRHAGQHLLRGGVDHVAPFSGLGFDELAADQQLDGGGQCGHVGGCVHGFVSGVVKGLQWGPPVHGMRANM
ncbi:hypothetical protein D3C71_957360 [compost metagenome]